MLSLEDGLRYVERRLNELYCKFPPSKWIWAVGYSGGKDSTALSLLLTEFSKRKGFTPIIIHEDTTVEIPAVNAVTKKVLEHFAKEEIQVEVLKPSKGFFNIMLERGYSFPAWNRRWCCRTLKYGLVKWWVRKMGRRVLNLLGIRGDEYRRRRGFVRKSNGILSAFPLVDVTERWVWSFLEEACSWFKELKKLYPHKSGSLGCWVCTVVSEDPTLKVLDSQLYEMKVRLVQARCLNTKIFTRLLNYYSKLRPDAFRGYEPQTLEAIREPSCKGKYCGSCKVKVWRFKRLCGN